MKINVILFERGPGEWVAQCLEYDIGAQASNLPDLFYELQRSLVGHIAICLKRDQEPFECLPPAPSQYWDKWRQERFAAISAPAVPFRIPGTVRRSDILPVEPEYVVTA